MAIPDIENNVVPVLDMKKIIMELQGTPYDSAVTSNLVEWNWNDVVDGATLNTNSTKKPTDSGGSIYSMNDWRGYNHFATPSFVNTKSVEKSLATGESNSITVVDTDDTFNIAGTDSWTISFWVKAGWSANLNTNIHFVIIQKSGATKQIEDMVKIIYAENTNRMEVRYGNVAGSGQWYNQGGWLFHANSGNFAAGFQAAGLGSTFWSSSNRGNTGDDDGGSETDYTMITVTNDGTNTAASLRLYWNSTGIGTAPIQTNNNSGSRSGNPISSTNDRRISIGSNGVNSGQASNGQQRKTGDNSATKYNDLTIWNKKLSDSEVTSLYNNGTAIDATTHSAQSNLIGYWKWEGNGNATRSNDNFTVSGSSSIVNK